MPFGNFFRTLRVGSLIGVTLALSHLLESEQRNYAAIGINAILFCLLFGINHGLERWITLVLVAAAAYLVSMYAEDLIVGGPVGEQINQAGGAAVNQLSGLLNVMQSTRGNNHLANANTKMEPDQSVFNRIMRGLSISESSGGVSLKHLVETGRKGIVKMTRDRDRDPVAKHTWH